MGRDKKREISMTQTIRDTLWKKPIVSWTVKIYNHEPQNDVSVNKGPHVDVGGPTRLYHLEML